MEEIIINKAQKSRPGDTVITSVSISKKLDDLRKAYNLSPTEIFRRGLAVTLADLGVGQYDNPLNKKRLEKIESVIKLEKYEEAIDKIDKLTNEIRDVLYKEVKNE